VVIGSHLHESGSCQKSVYVRILFATEKHTQLPSTEADVARASRKSKAIGVQHLIRVAKVIASCP
jgi:hypothetical protein